MNATSTFATPPIARSGFSTPHGAATGRLEPRRPCRDWNNDRARCFVRPVPPPPAQQFLPEGENPIWPAVGRGKSDAGSTHSAGAGHRSPVTKHRSKTVNCLVNVLSRLGLLTEDIDYHLIRASMVLIFLSFGYQKWFAYEAQVLIPYISHGPLIFWLYPVFGIRGASWFLGVSEWLIGSAAVPRVLGQAAWHPRRAWLDRYVHHDGHDHSVHAERMGSGGGISRHGRQRSVPDEGRGAAGCVDLLAQAGRDARSAVREPWRRRAAISLARIRSNRIANSHHVFVRSHDRI